MFISIDIGGTSTRVAVSDSLSDLKIRNKKEFKNTHNFESDFEQVNRIISESDQIKAIGIGSAGDVGLDRLSVKSAKNLVEYEGKPIVEMLSQKFNCQVFLENDGVAAAIGEAYFGNGKDKNFDLILWGSGIGGATVIHQKEKVLIKKINWYKNFEDWEKDCGGKELENQYKKNPAELSTEQWEETMQKFKQHLTGFIMTNQPSAIIFGGGVSIKQNERLKKLFKDIEIDLEISSLAEDAGIYGGFGLIRNELN